MYSMFFLSMSLSDELFSMFLKIFILFVVGEEVLFSILNGIVNQYLNISTR